MDQAGDSFRSTRKTAWEKEKQNSSLLAHRPHVFKDPRNLIRAREASVVIIKASGSMQLRTQLVGNWYRTLPRDVRARSTTICRGGNWGRREPKPHHAASWLAFALTLDVPGSIWLSPDSDFSKTLCPSSSAPIFFAILSMICEMFHLPAFWVLRKPWS